MRFEALLGVSVRGFVHIDVGDAAEWQSFLLATDGEEIISYESLLMIQNALRG